MSVEEDSVLFRICQVYISDNIGNQLLCSQSILFFMPQTKIEFVEFQHKSAKKFSQKEFSRFLFSNRLLEVLISFEQYIIVLILLCKFVSTTQPRPLSQNCLIRISCLSCPCPKKSKQQMFKSGQAGFQLCCPQSSKLQN